MKPSVKFFSALVAFTMTVMPSWAAYQYTSDGGMRYYYTVSNGKAILGNEKNGIIAVQYKYNGDWYNGTPPGVTKLTMPATLGGYPVVRICNGAFSNGTGAFTDLKELVLPNGVTTIDSSAFMYCKFTTMSFPGSLTSLGKCFHEYSPSTVIFEEGTGNLTLADNALCWSAYYGYGPSTVIFHRNAPTVGQHSIPWNNRNGTTVWVRPGSSGWGVSIPGKWQGADIKYLKTIDFDATSGTVSAPTRYVTDGSKVGTLPTPTCPGGTFNGWYTAKSGGTKITASTTVSANKIFYAQWTLNKYTVSFDLNGGEGDAPSRTQNWGTEIGALPEPTRTGYFFKGWFTESEGGSQIGATDKIECNKTYFAHWERDPIPEMVSGETVAEVLAGAADETLAAKLGTTRNYKNYRGWVDDKALEHGAVKGSPNAWLAYALDAPGLIAKPSAVAKEDFTFEAGSSVAEEPGKMAFDFGIDGVTIGEEAELDEVFAITGAATLEESAFTESGVTASLERTSDGKVSVSVEPPKDGNGKIPDKYFFRVRVK